ncbi:Alcohol dehydrogenase zinc-binding domain protein [Beutenbergia cavernae DSM 12333]|uniref:Alcohol dehydrogenase zinc-binding domain protein n=1 Tax=Beutenbergia cavernae (strain ATCC BAA-8 / DSM 12333 / CCUG 43141 / JCM 11478 / NBRC 16432 / NCIMB 13614 / HKI 0122) TaxID=471853 RepID=C5C1A4_BEUC1|nr:alcohol dehydrogenase catalytic domain-containing protein [Beutenbergia cavernae]ACQ81514.1 Alcohol dehydrogenase zinc-binding domain protein [Beutenbergia cavernae DSM 12333]
MRRAVLHGVGDLRLEEGPDPEVPEGFTLVRMTDVGLCGSDLHWFSEGGIGDARLTRPIVPGHEQAGIAQDGPYAGRLVAVDPAIPCGRCEMCLEGEVNLCPTVRFSGHGALDGGLQELLAWPTDRLFPLPDGMTGADGAVLEPLGVALHAWDLAHVRAASDVVVVGTGPIGLLLVQLARHFAGGRVIAVEPLAHRREAALRYGADLALTPQEAAAIDVAELGAGELGVDVAFEVAGTNDAIETSMRLVKPGARVVLAGIPDDDTSTFTASTARRKGLTFLLVRRMKEMYPRAIRLAETGIVDVRSLVSARIPLDEAPRAFAEAVERTGLKVVIGLD